MSGQGELRWPVFCAESTKARQTSAVERGNVGLAPRCLSAFHDHITNERRFRFQMNTERRFVLVDADPGLNRSPTLDEISGLAHEIYREEGCPEGRADEHWYAAEGFLKREMFTCD
jgi:hypothetical protein